MKIYLIRHSETDFTQIDQAGCIGFSRELTRITPHGITLAKQLAHNPIFKETQLLLVSPYTRTMETAMEVIKQNDLPTQVELMLHEWMPDKTGRKIASYRQLQEVYADYLNGTHLSGFDYESPTEVKQRVETVLDHYKSDYDCIACVTHGQVIKQLTGITDDADLEYCGIYQIEY